MAFLCDCQRSLSKIDDDAVVVFNHKYLYERVLVNSTLYREKWYDVLAVIDNTIEILWRYCQFLFVHLWNALKTQYFPISTEKSKRVKGRRLGFEWKTNC